MTKHVLGVISDTHGLVRPEALEALGGVEQILHAGDIGSQHVLDMLQSIAPVTAIRGNNDKGAWARALPEVKDVSVGATRIHMLHELEQLDLDPAADGFNVVVSGHSHQPVIEERGGVLYVNPGSAGPRRFRLPVTLARLTISGDSVSAELVDLDSSNAPN
jgi:uncharacterized protein